MAPFLQSSASTRIMVEGPSTPVIPDFTRYTAREHSSNSFINGIEAYFGSRSYLTNLISNDQQSMENFSRSNKPCNCTMFVQLEIATQVYFYSYNLASLPDLDNPGWVLTLLEDDFYFEGKVITSVSPYRMIKLKNYNRCDSMGGTDPGPIVAVDPPSVPDSNFIYDQFYFFTEIMRHPLYIMYCLSMFFKVFIEFIDHHEEWIEFVNTYWNPRIIYFYNFTISNLYFYSTWYIMFWSFVYHYFASFVNKNTIYLDYYHAVKGAYEASYISVVVVSVLSFFLRILASIFTFLYGILYFAVSLRRGHGLRHSFFLAFSYYMTPYVRRRLGYDRTTAMGGTDPGPPPSNAAVVKDLGAVSIERVAKTLPSSNLFERLPHLKFRARDGPFIKMNRLRPTSSSISLKGPSAPQTMEPNFVDVELDKLTFLDLADLNRELFQPDREVVMPEFDVKVAHHKRKSQKLILRKIRQEKKELAAHLPVDKGRIKQDRRSKNLFSGVLSQNVIKHTEISSIIRGYNTLSEFKCSSKLRKLVNKFLLDDVSVRLWKAKFRQHFISWKKIRPQAGINSEGLLHVLKNYISREYPTLVSTLNGIEEIDILFFLNMVNAAYRDDGTLNAAEISLLYLFLSRRFMSFPEVLLFFKDLAAELFTDIKREYDEVMEEHAYWETQKDPRTGSFYDEASDFSVDGIRYQADNAKDTFDFLLSGFRKFRNSPNPKKIAAFFSGIFSLLVTTLPSEGAALALKMLDFINTTGDGMSLLDLLADMTVSFEKSIDRYAESGNVMDLFGQSWDDTIYEQATKLIRILHNQKTEPSAELRKYIIDADELLQKSIKNTNFQVVRILSTLRDTKEMVEQALKGFRPAPIGIIVTGQPGLGKTTLVNLIDKALAHRKGFPENLPITMNFITGTKHQTVPPICEIVLINDAFQVRDEDMETPTITLFQTLVDTDPLKIETASLSEKANAHIAHSLVMATTNVMNFYCTKAASTVEKLDRRYYILHVAPSKKLLALCGEDVSQMAEIFREKMAEGEEGLVDYTLGRMDNNPETNPKSKSSNKTLFLDISDRKPKKLFTDYIDVVNHVVDMVMDRPVSGVKESRFCTDCGHMMRGDTCSCEVRPQGNGLSVTHVITPSKSAVGLVVGVASLSALMSIIGFALFFTKNNYQPQGNFVTKISNMPPPEEASIRPFLSKAPWLGKAQSAVVGLSRNLDDGNTLKVCGTFLKENLLISVGHFFTGKFGSQSRIRPLFEGEVFTITIGSNSMKVAYHERCYLGANSRVTDQSHDCAYYYIFNAPAIISLYDYLPPTKSYTAKPVFVGNHKPGRMMTSSFDGHHFKYDVATLDGECGRPIRTDSGSVVGIHFAYDETAKLAMGFYVCREDVDLVASHFEERGLLCPTFNTEVPQSLKTINLDGTLHPQSDASWILEKNPALFWRGDAIPLGHLPSCDKPSVSCRKTEWFGTFGGRCKAYGKPHFKHAKKCPDGIFRSSITKRWDQSTIDQLFDPNILEKALQYYVNNIPEPSKKMHPLCDTTAIVGSVENTLINPRHNGKALGWSLKTQHVTSKNGFVYIPEEDAFVAHDVILTEISRVKKEIYEGKFLPCVVKSNLKDEAYPLEKSALGGGRQFFVVDWIQNLMLRKYLLPVITHLMENPYYSGVFATMNAGSSEWKELYLFLTRFGEQVSAGDQAGMDNHHRLLTLQIARFYYLIAKKIGYTEEEAVITRNVFIQSSRYILHSEGNFYLCMSKLVSGKTDTLVTNCVALMLIILYALVDKRPDLNPFEHSSIATTGDDNVTGLDHEVYPLDVSFIGTSAELLGFEMTNGDKQKDLILAHISEIDYLKRAFVKDGDRVWAPLSLDSIYKSLSYCVGCSVLDEHDRNLSTAQSASREMFLHGRTSYEEFVREISPLTPEIQYPTYDSLLVRYDNKEFHTWDQVPMDLIPIENLKQITGSTDHISGSTSLSMPILTRQSALIKPPGGILWCTDPKYLISTTSNSNLPSTSAPGDVNSLNPTESMEAVTMETPITELPENELEKQLVSSGGRYPTSPQPGSSIEEFLARPRKIATFPVASQSATIFSLIQSYRALPEVSKFLSSWEYVRCDWVATVVFTGSSQFLGKGRVIFWPATSSDTYSEAVTDSYYNGNAVTSPISTSQLPHIDVDFSETKTQEIVLPYSSSNLYYEPINGGWRAKYIPLNTLQKANGGTPGSVDISLWIRCENVTVNRVRPQAEEAPSGVISNALSYAAFVGRNLPFAWMPPAVKALDFASDTAKFFGYSRPPVEPQEAIIARNNGNFAFVSGQPDFSYGVGMDPHTLRSVDKSIIPLSHPEDTQIRWLLSKESMVLANASLATAYTVAPNVVTMEPTNVMVLTPTAFVASMFERWTGDMSYCLDVVSSPLIRWRLGVVIIPPGELVPLTFPTDGGYITHVFECVGSTCYEFDVPYLYTEPFQVNDDLIDFENLNDSHTRMAFFSLMEPAGPSDTPVVPSINIWMKGGPNLSFGVPSLDTLTGLRPQADGLGNMSLSVFGEEVVDLIALTRRLSPNLLLAVKAPISEYANMGIAFPITPFAPGTGDITTADLAQLGPSLWTFESYMRLAYFGCVGSSVKVVDYTSPLSTSISRGNFVIGSAHRTPGTLSTLSVSPYSRLFSTGDTRGMVIQSMDHAVGLQTRFPDRSGKMFRRALNAAPTTATVPTECAQYLSEYPLNPNQLFNIWSGTGDDFFLGGFLFAPRLVPII